MRTMTRAARVALLTPLVLLAACGSDSEGATEGRGDSAARAVEATAAASDASSTTTAAHEDKPHYGYDGEEGPEHWGELSADWATCASGVQQSPIDLPAVEAAEVQDQPITFDYQPSALKLVNNGHTIQADYDPGSSITVGGQTYDLLQFHFHAGSEHTVAGEQAPLEIHFVHADAQKNLAVVGVLIDEAADEGNTAYEAILSALPAEQTEASAVVEGVTINAADLLPEGTTYQAYPGSLTTPGCAEGVAWHVMTDRVEVPAEQIAAFTEIHHNNFRPVQPLGEREVVTAG